MAEVALGVALAESAKSLALCDLSLAVVVLELHGFEALAEGAVQPAGPNRRELARVADQQSLAVGVLDQRSTGASTRVSAMPASSMTSTQPGGRPREWRASASRE